MDTCEELVKNVKRSSQTDIEKFSFLHPDGQRLILSWFNRAWAVRDCVPSDSFEPFIFTWISFNGWASCVTGLDNDSDWKKALMVSDVICRDFSRLVAEQKSLVSGYANQFYKLWPIFKAQDIHRQGIYGYETRNREEMVKRYFDARIEHFEPECWMRHREQGNPIPLDWPHTLAVLYHVRCNLFHGEKLAHSEMDAMIVTSAFRTLANFFNASGYMI